MPPWKEIQIKIPHGTYKQLNELMKILSDDEEEFDNMKMMAAIIINEIYSNIRKIPSEKRAEALFNLATDNYEMLKKRNFTNNPRALGKLAT